MDLGEEQIDRYSRQLLLEQVGGAGQARLLGSRALLIGAGGLGSPTALYLAAAGVGALTIVDPDAVALSNLNRQILHRTGDQGRPKVHRAAEALAALNPEVRVTPVVGRVEPAGAEALFRAHDVVVDGSDNFETRFLANDVAVRSGVPLVHGAVQGWIGQAMVVRPGQGPCYRCLFEAPPPPGEVPPCSQAGIVGAVAGVLGAVMATEVLKLLLGVGEPLVGRLWTWDGLEGTSRTVRFPQNPTCTACGEAGHGN